MDLPDTPGTQHEDIRGPEAADGKPLEGTRSTYDDRLLDLRKWLESPQWIAVALGVLVIYWLQRPIYLLPADVQGLVRIEAKPRLRIPLIVVFSSILYRGVLSAEC